MSEIAYRIVARADSEVLADKAIMQRPKTVTSSPSR